MPLLLSVYKNAPRYRGAFFCLRNYTPSFSSAASFSQLQKMAMACFSSSTGGKEGAMRMLLSLGSMP